ncbi:hypothetical protein K933_00292 [Candidatus Halobonum tyrrellensis G22]|uniref:Uncharacterized protein n=1 Tax=Candidatus Halobonum tyrrellensis G22 TaxID=1324957 RepID=V4HGW8_9EURY|nr:hypothetical protein K933_00292 [Candidatus Halobonum tyrrellensis G22]
MAPGRTARRPLREAVDEPERDRSVDAVGGDAAGVADDEAETRQVRHRSRADPDAGRCARPTAGHHA